MSIIQVGVAVHTDEGYDLTVSCDENGTKLDVDGLDEPALVDFPELARAAQAAADAFAGLTS